MSESERKSDRSEANPSERNEVNLAAPWAALTELGLGSYANLIRCRSILGDSSAAALEAFITERTKLHETYIKEQERTKRIGMILSVILILGAAALVLFAPAGRETLSYWIGAALVIFAAGAMGYQRIWGKSKNLSFGADQDRNDL